MIKVEPLLDYMTQVADNLLVGKEHDDVLAETARIRRKLADPSLYLAVVGEFSSGKSTFINALVGERLLKDDVRPTTACATYIRRRSHQRTVTAKFRSGAVHTATETDWTSLAVYIRKIYGVEANSFRDLIHVLTSDSRVASQVVGLDIDLPEAPLPEHVVIIDTPGFNPGNDNGGRHQEITRDTVEKVADLALILTPQEQAMSASLLGFVAASLARCIHRCTFVVTKMDNQYFPELRAETLSYVRTRLIADLNLPDAPLYGLSSVAVLPGISVPPGREQDFAALRSDFHAFVRAVGDSLARNRELVLSEHILSLLDRTVAMCAAMLAEKPRILQRERTFLEQHRIEAVAELTARLVGQACLDVRRKAGEVIDGYSVFDTSSQNACSRMREILGSTPTMSDSVFSSLTPKINDACNEEMNKALEDIGNRINHTLRGYVQERIAAISRIFSEHYAGFEGLRFNSAVPSAQVMNIPRTSVNTFDAHAAIRDFEKKEGNAAMLGAGGGLLAGLAICTGPVGLTFAAIAGMFGAMMMGGDKSDEMRTAASNALLSEIRKDFKTASDNTKAVVDKTVEGYCRLITEFGERHVERYGHEVDRQIRRRTERLEEIDGQIEILKVVSSNLNLMSQSITSHIDNLRQK